MTQSPEPSPDEQQRGPYAAPPPLYGTPKSAAPGPSPKARAEASRYVRRSVLLGMLALALSLLFAPLGLALGIYVVVRVGRSRARVRASGLGRSATVVPMASGALAIVVSSLVLVSLALFFQEVSDYSDCMSGANTQIAKDKCTNTLRDGVQHKIDSWTS